MLRALSIKNLALIDEISIELDEGLNVFTGETGAGKTIILHGLELLLGARGDAEKIRSGSERLEVEGLFEEPCDSRALEILRQQGLAEGDECGQILVRRTMSSDGKSRCWINGSLCNVSTLGAIGEFLVDVHGQHEHQRLLKPGNHLEYLDRYGDGGHQSLLESYEESYRLWRDVLDELKNNAMAEDIRKKTVSDSREVIASIEAISPQPGELETLEIKLRAAREHETLFRFLEQAEAQLDDELRGGAVDRLASALSLMRKAEGVDPRLADLADMLEVAWSNSAEAASGIRRYREEMSFDPDEVESMESRVFAIRELYRKYGGGWDEVRKELEAARRRIEVMESYASRMRELEEIAASRRNAVEALSVELTASRNGLARKLRQAVSEEIEDMGMTATSFEIRMEKRGDLTEAGRERIEMMISPAPGEPLMPISRIASGGELARLMLALKIALARADQVPTLVFDEVDAGIGGMTAGNIGAKLSALSRYHQVLCVTHLPQIAAFADRQFRIFKKESDSRMMTKIEELDGEGRVAELARMLGGEEKTAKQHARALMRSVKKAK